MRRFICGQDEIYGCITDSVCGHPPALAIQQAHDCFVIFGWIGLNATKLPVLPPRLLVRLTHEPAFEPAVNAKLDTTDADPLVTFIWFQPDAVQRLFRVLSRSIN